VDTIFDMAGLYNALLFKMAVCDGFLGNTRAWRRFDFFFLVFVFCVLSPGQPGLGFFL
jgi:uncharacterized membrane protein